MSPEEHEELAAAVREYGAFPMPVPEPMDLVAAGRALDLLSLMDERAASKVSPVLSGVLDEAERLRARVAELETELAWRNAERERWMDVHALVERAIDKGWSAIDTADIEAELGPEPASVPAPAEADGISRRIAPTQALREDPHDGPLHHDYRVGRDLPSPGGA